MTLKEEIPKYIPCTCDEIYKSRGLEAPDCPYHNYSDDIERLARLYAEAKCKELEQKIIEQAYTNPHYENATHFGTDFGYVYISALKLIITESIPKFD